jgi:phosphoglycerate dehydrogenase-like enzyme
VSSDTKPLILLANVGRKPSRIAEIRQAVRKAYQGLEEVNHELRLPTDRQQLLEFLPGTEVLFTFGLDDEILEAGQDLKWIHLGVSGVDRHLVPGVHRPGLQLTNSRGMHTTAMSEFVLAAMFAQGNALLNFRDCQRTRCWEPRKHLPSFRTLAGTTLGILGLGAVGQTLAVKAEALGMRVVGFKRNPGKAVDYPGVSQVFGPEDIDEVLAQSDWLVLLMPLTQETRGLLSRARIGKIKKGAYLISVGRGEVVDEKALRKALRSGRLSGATLDVFRTEPLPPESEFWYLPNVFVTPHVSGNFPGYIEKASRVFGKNLARYLRHQELTNQVDLELGY